MARHPSYGEFTENYVRRTAVLGGQSDFVFEPVLVKKGKSTREVTDTLILLGRQAVVVQVKSRHISKIGSDSLTRARAWLDKNIAIAMKQIDGTVRTLRSRTMPWRSERGVEIEWRPDRVEELYGLVVINYTPPPEYVPQVTALIPTLVLHVSDWELLNKTAYTAAGVIEYIKGRSTLPGFRIPLGEERDMIGATLEVEHGGNSVPIINGRPLPGSFDRVRETYPASVFGSQPNDKLAYLIDAMIISAADRDATASSTMDPDDYLCIVEALERIPRLDRVPLGAKMMEKSHLAHEQNRERHFVARLPSGGRLLFVADPAPREQRMRFLGSLAIGVHLGVDVPEGSGRNEGITLAVATEPYPNEGRSHDYVFIQGALDVPEEVREEALALLKDNSAPVRPIDQDVIDRALSL